MQILIRNDENRPIYEQIFCQIRDAILSGDPAEGEALPSIRALAKDLRVSVITTKRAYDELEQAGLIHTVAGKGCFVAPRNQELLREQYLREIETHLRAVAHLAAAAQIPDAELLELYHLLTEEEHK